MKSLIHPRQMSRKELEAVLQLQEQSLKDANQMPLVPTLLQLSEVVGVTMALEKRSVKWKSDMVLPSGQHPLFKAL